MVDDHADGGLVLDAAGDDDVGDEPLGLDVPVEDGFHVAEPLFDGAFDGAAAFADVADDFSLAGSSADLILSRLLLCGSCMEEGRGFLLLRERQTSASASTKIFMSSISRIRGSFRARMPSSMRT